MTEPAGSVIPVSRLEVRDLTVTFGATHAVQNVTFALPVGQIVGLLGHNGAGKSTIMNVLSGVVPATSGGFAVDGEAAPVRLSPGAATGLGVTIVHQEPALTPSLSVVDNMFLGRRSRVPRTQQRLLAEEALKRLGTEINIDAPVGALDLGKRQLVDIARGLVGGEMKVLLLDEPTAALGAADTAALHTLIRELAQSGVTVLYVSHRLPDIFDVCERVLVLRGGELVYDETSHTADAPAITGALAPNLTAADRVITRRRDLRLAVETDHGRIDAYAGEVLGLFGMAGAEQFALAARLFGAGDEIDVHLDGAPVAIKTPGAAMRLGFGFVPADREADALIGNQTALETIMFPWLSSTRSRGWWVTPTVGAEIYARAKETLSIHGPGARAPIGSFSGGNRQKHLIARWTQVASPRVLILAQPTQGVDITARADITRAAREAAASGTAVIVASAEADEIAMMCDRAIVVYRDQQADVTGGVDFDARLLATLLALADPDTTVHQTTP